MGPVVTSCGGWCVLVPIIVDSALPVKPLWPRKATGTVRFSNGMTTNRLVAARLSA